MNAFTITGLLVLIPSAFLATLTLINGRKKIHYLHTAFIFSVALWGLGIFQISTIKEMELSLLWWRITEVSVILIPALFVSFVFEFLKLKKKLFLTIVYILTAILLYFNIFTNYFIDKVYFAFDKFFYISWTPLFSLYILMYAFLAVYCITLLIKAYKKSSGDYKLQIEYLFLAFAIGFGGGFTSYLPMYHIMVLPIWNSLISISIFLIAYAIFEFKLMDIKVIATELLALIIASISFVQIFQSQTLNEIILKSVFFLGITIIGILLVRSVIQEVRRREDMQKLSEQLELANVKLKALDEAKSEFISIASHQLRTPLSFIKGTVSMALEGVWGKMSEPQVKELNKIYISNERLIKLIDDLLDISRIESKRMEFNFEAVDLVKMAEETTQQFMTKAKDKKLFLIFKKSEKPVSKVKADSLKLRQVVMNLIDNALKYTDEGGITVEVTDGVGKVKFSVTDTGVGISEVQQDMLFQKFARNKEVAKAHTEGMGLGLYLAAQLIESHNGKIWVESDGEGHGSKFCFYVPKAK